MTRLDNIPLDRLPLRLRGVEIDAGQKVCVEVDLLNDDGERAVITAEGEDANAAVQAAEAAAAQQTGDDTYVMNEYRGA